MENSGCKLIFQYPAKEDDLEYRFIFEYWGTTVFANVEGFKQNYSDHLILNVKDYL